MATSTMCKCLMLFVAGINLCSTAVAHETGRVEVGDFCRSWGFDQNTAAGNKSTAVGDYHTAIPGAKGLYRKGDGLYKGSFAAANADECADECSTDANKAGCSAFAYSAGSKSCQMYNKVGALGTYAATGWSLYQKKAAGDAGTVATTAVPCSGPDHTFNHKTGEPCPKATRKDCSFNQERGRGKWSDKIDIIVYAENPGFAAEDCAALCVATSACKRYAYQDTRPATNPNVCITYKNGIHVDSSDKGQVFETYTCKMITAAATDAPTKATAAKITTKATTAKADATAKATTAKATTKTTTTTATATTTMTTTTTTTATTTTSTTTTTATSTTTTGAPTTTVAGGPACDKSFVATNGNIFCQVRAWCAGADGQSDGHDDYSHYGKKGDWRAYDYGATAVGIEQGECDLKLFDTMIPPACWETSQVTDMSWLFAHFSTCNPDIDSWRVDAVTDMEGMFYSAQVFNQPLNSWRVDAVTRMFYMFKDAKEFNQPLNSWRVDKVATMYDMFSFAKKFNQPLNSWRVDAVTQMDLMFSGAALFNQRLDSWRVDAVVNMENIRMFAGAGCASLEKCGGQ